MRNSKNGKNTQRIKTEIATQIIDTAFSNEDGLVTNVNHINYATFADLKAMEQRIQSNIDDKLADWRAMEKRLESMINAMNNSTQLARATRKDHNH